jgi:phosphoribosyl-ATP pyrophosphohydrolase/phosphoribosyl-AMP cyclohydrolase/histidinol dehydrogenase
MSPPLRAVSLDALPTLRRRAVEADTLTAAARIVEAVRAGGEPALRQHAEALGDIQPGEPLVLGPEALRAALDAVPKDSRAALERCAERVHRFATAHRVALRDLVSPIPGGRAGVQYAAVERAGCYAPGGRFPLPSSVLMTAVTARAAGVREVWVASPRPSLETRAAAAIAGADALLAVGGAQAIAALAYGAGPVPACDALVGPGNRWVTAAKQLVAGEVRIDMLAGPSELVVLADSSADPALVAADLLAQAEHDDDALPILVSLSPSFTEAVQAELLAQLSTLPTAHIAARALKNGFVVPCDSLSDAIAACDRLAPEHLSLHLHDAQAAADQLQHYGGLFIGAGAAEVLGDYSAGPNHVLPTGGTARSVGGLSVLTFLRARTWIAVDDPVEAKILAQDASIVARLEGLEAHARAADRRAG